MPLVITTTLLHSLFYFQPTYCPTIGFKWGQNNKKKYQPRQLSFLFLQFLDTVWQMWEQAPFLFEFDSTLLIFLIDALYSTRFGTFLSDTEKERKTGTTKFMRNLIYKNPVIHVTLSMVQVKTSLCSVRYPYGHI